MVDEVLGTHPYNGISITIVHDFEEHARLLESLSRVMVYQCFHTLAQFIMMSTGTVVCFYKTSKVGFGIMHFVTTSQTATPSSDLNTQVESYVS